MARMNPKKTVRKQRKASSKRRVMSPSAKGKKGGKASANRRRFQRRSGRDRRVRTGTIADRQFVDTQHLPVVEYAADQLQPMLPGPEDGDFADRGRLSDEVGYLDIDPELGDS